MSEPMDMTNLAGHGLGPGWGVLGWGGVGAWVANFLRSREAREAAKEAAKEAAEMARQLALLNQSMVDVKEELKLQRNYGERLALLERDVKALHDRMDARERGESTARGRRIKR
jgi:hypothetical protein